jgi:hypothetical protein
MLGSESGGSLSNVVVESTPHDIYETGLIVHENEPMLGEVVAAHVTATSDVIYRRVRLV